MQNFNTNQTRHFYVAGAIDGNVDTPLDIALGQAQTGEFFFKYMNADGLATRTDLINPKKVTSLKLTTAKQMARPLQAHVIKHDASAISLANLVGKAITLSVTLHGYIDYDESNGFVVTATIVGDSVNTASEAAFNKAMAMAIAKAMPIKDRQFPLFHVYSNGSEVTVGSDASSVTGSANGIVLVESMQRYVRGKLSGEPIPFSVAFHAAEGNLEDIAWGTDTISTVEAVNTAQSTSISPVEVPSNRMLADLEYFAYGERGDYYRGYRYPNEVEPTYVIDMTSDYNVLSIEYFWNGPAEDNVKSPRLIQIAAKGDIAANLYALVNGYVDGGISALGARVSALEEGSSSEQQ